MINKKGFALDQFRTVMVLDFNIFKVLISFHLKFKLWFKQEEDIRSLEEQISQNEARLEKSRSAFLLEEAKQKELEQTFKNIEKEMKSKIDAADGIKVSLCHSSITIV